MLGVVRLGMWMISSSPLEGKAAFSLVAEEEARTLVRTVESIWN